MKCFGSQYNEVNNLIWEKSLPSTINGIGTTYFGKRNLETESGVCEFCQNQTTLSTYETTYFFCFVFIPLIPLGKKQIIDDCGVCRRHRVLPVAEWQRVREEAIEASSTQLAEKMTDPKAAIEHLQTLTAFKQMDEARDLCEAIEATHANDFDVQFFLGAWHEKYGNAEVADRCFDSAFKIDPENPVAIRAKGMGLVEQNKLDEAKTLLSALNPPSQHFDPGVFYQLGNAFQQQERHADALEQYKLVSENAPGIGKDKTFRQSVKKSEKALGHTAATILPKQSVFGTKGFWWTAAALGLLALLIGSMIWIGSNRTVHVVNGNSVPITVKIDDGESITVQPSRYKAVKLAEGKHQVELVSPDAGIEPETFQLSSSFWTRLFNSPAFVLDPTRTSAVTWEETTYSDHPVDDGDFEWEVGELMTQYSDVDYIFKEFPDQLEVEGNTKSVTKTRVSFEAIPPTLLISLTDLEPATRMKVAEAHVGLNPDSAETWGVYRMVAESCGKTDQALALMESRLEDKPLKIEMHRAYHEVFKANGGSEQDLTDRYQAYLKDDPDNPDLLYLNGRLAPGVSGSAALFNQAIEKDPDHVFALNGLAYNQMASGKFKAAKETLERIIELAPEHEYYRDEYISSLYASKDYKSLGPELDSISDPFRKAKEKATLLKLTGKERQYKNLSSKFSRESAESAPESVNDFRLLELHWSYLNNDLKSYQKMIDKLDTSLTKDLFQFQLDIEQDRTSGALKLLEKLPSQYSDQAIPLVAVAKNRTGDKSDAKKIWEDFLGKLDSHGETHFVELARRAQEKEVSVDEFLELSLAPSQKRSWVRSLVARH